MFNPESYTWFYHLTKPNPINIETNLTQTKRMIGEVAIQAFIYSIPNFEYLVFSPEHSSETLRTTA